jgi:uncharacterized protein involved in type VI secretion and phage assembly
MSLLDAFVNQQSHINRAERIFGVVVGVVTNNQDPDNMGRIKVKFPWLSDEEESHWARVLTPMAGKDRGIYFLPEVDDEVLVAFEHGMIEFPYVIGSLWNGEDAAPASNENGENNIRIIKSRSGHIIRIDDTGDKGKIEIVDAGKKNSIVISADDDTITIAADADITIQSSNGKLIINAKGVEIKSQAEVKVEAGSDMDLKASGQMNVKGSMVNIN